TVRRARDVVDAAGYTLEAVTERVGPDVFAHLSARERAPLVRATRAGDRLDVLLRLFLIGEPVPHDDARAALAPMAVDEWVAGGLVAVNGDEVEGLMTLRPLGGPERRLVAHDRPDRSGAVQPDHVVGVSASTVALAGATIRRPIDAAFDLGTGCGIQALHAADHSASVVASDLNQRAVACATLTMELNDIGHVSVRSGDRFEPVAGEQFDLIVSNPPFVISPSRRYLFRDSGLPLDEISRSVVGTAPQHLRDGGHCQLLASWAHVRGQDWEDRLAGWVVGKACDVLVLEREVLDPSEHAASWLRQTERPERWQDEYDAWLDDCAAHGVEGVGIGLISMRKRSDSSEPCFRAESAPQDVALDCGDHIGALFELADFLGHVDDAALLDVSFRVAPDVVFDERRTPDADGWSTVSRHLRQTAGLRHEGEVDDVIADVVGACNGDRTLRQVLATVCAERGLPDEELRAAALPIVRSLVGRAFVLPVG
ncbi:MAG TPA: methyltransferase, partial [Ilumatobacteraceae bacterium]